MMYLSLLWIELYLTDERNLETQLKSHCLKSTTDIIEKGVKYNES